MRQTTNVRDHLEWYWLALLQQWSCPDAASRQAFVDLAARYHTDDRPYHNLDHVSAVLEAVALLAKYPAPALLLAVWFHDAVYDPRAGDNEENSAALAESVLASLGVPIAIRTETGRLIRLTKTHQPAELDRDGQILVDADLSILGAEETTYDRYARAIRQEYAWVPEDQYRAGRSRVLEGFLRRPRIFTTEVARARWEKAARANLQRELALLGQ
jgi:predicted metal-dependent HD superfamily phosphohydrolase